MIADSNQILDEPLFLDRHHLQYLSGCLLEAIKNGRWGRIGKSNLVSRHVRLANERSPLVYQSPEPMNSMSPSSKVWSGTGVR